MHSVQSTDRAGETLPALENPYLDAVTDGESGERSPAELTEAYAWAIPNAAAIAAVAREGPILEVGAGAGYWTYLLRQVDVDVVATDPAAPIDPEWSPVEPLDASTAVEQYPERTLLVVWPSDGESWAADALRATEAETCIYVGEGPGGCTADEGFHRLLREDWHRETVVSIPQYPHAHDDLEVWRADRGLLSKLSIRSMRAVAFEDV
jgi:hypothetical protein